MLEIVSSSRFKRDLKTVTKRGYDISLLKEIVDTLAEEKELPLKNKDHFLTGEYKGFRECHIAPDWLLIYKVSGEALELLLMRTGSHSDLF